MGRQAHEDRRCARLDFFFGVTCTYCSIPASTWLFSPCYFMLYRVGPAELVRLQNDSMYHQL